ncbi:MAG: ornithine cyclodeaminase family protein [Anaerolineae bacterium]
MATIRFLTRSEVVQALPMIEAIDGMKRAYGALSAQTAAMPLRVRVPGQDEGVSLVMPAHLTDSGEMGVKVVSVFPKNSTRDLPTIHAVVLVLDAHTGQILGMMEGGSLTAIRTGAGAGAATDLLANPDARTVAIIGSGVQARTQLEAVCAVRPIEHAWVYSPTRAHALTFAQSLAGQEGLPLVIDVAPSADEAIAQADIICTATTSSQPVFDGSRLREGMHINAVGSFTPTMQEVDDITLQRASIFVDSREAVRAEAGELVIALANGAISEDEIQIEIGDVVNGNHPGRQSPDEITYFKSVGVAVQDAVGARIALDQAQALNIGTVLDLDT